MTTTTMTTTAMTKATTTTATIKATTMTAMTTTTMTTTKATTTTALTTDDKKVNLSLEILPPRKHRLFYEMKFVTKTLQGVKSRSFPSRYFSNFGIKYLMRRLQFLNLDTPLRKSVITEM